MFKETFKNIFKYKSNNLKVYHSSELLLKITQKEYEYDLNNLSSLYTRTGIIFAFLGLYFNALLHKPIDLNTKITIQKSIDIIIYLSPIIAYFGSLVFVSISIYFLLKVILTDSYKRIDINKGFNEQSALMSKELACYYMMETYIKVLKFNKKISENKFKSYKFSIIYLSVSLALYAIYISIIYVKEGKI